jgi:hypothetical protein
MVFTKYEEDWLVFRKKIEDKIKGRCIINNKNWKKLRDFHFEEFIKTVPKPYGLLFRMIYMSNIHKEIPCIHRVYRKYKKEKQQELTNTLGLKTRAEAFRRYR